MPKAFRSFFGPCNEDFALLQRVGALGVLLSLASEALQLFLEAFAVKVLISRWRSRRGHLVCCSLLGRHDDDAERR